MRKNKKDMKGKIIVLIPARGGSKGIPQKNIVSFAGKPLLAWTIIQAKLSKYVSSVYVSSDDPAILSIVRRYGAQTILRPKNISDDKASSESALLHALRYIKEDPDYVVFLQATSPLRKPDDIDKAIDKIINEGADSLMSLVESHDFIWEKVRSQLRSITYDFKNRKMRQDFKPLYRENGSIYIFKPQVLLTYKNRLGGKLAMYLMESWQGIDINEPLDLQQCEWFFWKYLSKMYRKCILDELRLIVYDFDGVMTNNKVFIDSQGNEWAKVSRADGLAVAKIRQMGIKQLILSSERNPVVKKRADKLRLECIQSRNSKEVDLKKYLNKYGIDKDKVMFIGNDINDKEVMKYVGYPIATNDAHNEIKQISKLILDSKGGEGAVREMLDILSEE